MPHKKIIPLWKRLTKNKEGRNKKASGITGSLYIKLAPSPTLENRHG
jgi:hypothetical protein